MGHINNGGICGKFRREFSWKWWNEEEIDFERLDIQMIIQMRMMKVKLTRKMKKLAR